MSNPNLASLNATIKVIGIGGGGGNALNTMIESNLSGVEFIAANTDIQALESNLAPVKIQLGRELTKGLGAGANPETGRNAALEDKSIIQEVLAGADMVFITAGMGGGTGTGAAPVIAQVARELGALTVGVVTKPFIFEGKRRRLQSEFGVHALKQSVDTLITIPNQRLLNIAPNDMSMLDGFKLADEILLNAVKGISDIINIPGRVNVDFADVKTIMSEMGMALMGIGTSTGSNRAAEAAQAAINSPLLEDIDVEGATGILINITGSSQMTLHEISEASTLIQEASHEDANIIFGAVIDENMDDKVRVTVIATGFEQNQSIMMDEEKDSRDKSQMHLSHNRPQEHLPQHFKERRQGATSLNPYKALQQHRQKHAPFNIEKGLEESHSHKHEESKKHAHKAYAEYAPKQESEVKNIELPKHAKEDERPNSQPADESSHLSENLEQGKVSFDNLTQWTFDMADKNAESKTLENNNDEVKSPSHNVNYTENALNLAKELSKETEQEAQI